MVILSDQQLRFLSLERRFVSTQFGVMYALDSPFVQKRRLNAADRAKTFRGVIASAAATFRWRPPPRAGISVSAQFFDWRPNHPRATRLAKYHLDLMKGILFRDDAQVVRLQVLLYPGDAGEGTGHFHIERESLVRRRRRLIESARRGWLLEDLEIDDIGPPYSDGQTFNELLLAVENMEQHEQLKNLSGWHRTQLDQERQRLRADLQAAYLAALTTDWRQRQVDQTPLDAFKVTIASAPLALESEHVPGLSSARLVRRSMRRVTEELLERLPTLAELRTPYEIDLEVVHSNRGVPKDLDNAALDALAGIHSSGLGRGSRFHGFRIQSVSGPEAVLRARLLPAGSLTFLQRWEDAALDYLGDSLPQP